PDLCKPAPTLLQRNEVTPGCETPRCAGDKIRSVHAEWYRALTSYSCRTPGPLAFRCRNSTRPNLTGTRHTLL
ncbi:hypothetical protein J6590_015903, partial [Homalodisca vitripennis]